MSAVDCSLSVEAFVSAGFISHFAGAGSANADARLCRDMKYS
jgi:hypothetical protein